MSQNYSIKDSSKSNNKAFFNLEPSLFAEIDKWQAENVSGGCISTSAESFAVPQKSSSSTWALSFMF